MRRQALRQGHANHRAPVLELLEAQPAELLREYPFLEEEEPFVTQPPQWMVGIEAGTPGSRASAGGTGCCASEEMDAIRVRE